MNIDTEIITLSKKIVLDTLKDIDRSGDVEMHLLADGSETVTRRSQLISPLRLLIKDLVGKGETSTVTAGVDPCGYLLEDDDETT